MDFKEIFVGEKREFRPEDSAFKLITDGWMGIAIAAVLGWLAVYLNGVLKIGGNKYFDALVLAVVLGIIVRFILSKTMSEDKYVFKMVPGLIAAQIILLPIAIILYGAKNFKVKEILGITTGSPMVLVQLIIMVTIVFGVMYFIAKKLGLTDKMAYLLGFGSAVCGSSAIAVTAPILRTEGDETSAALVINTIIVIVGFILFTGVMVNMMAPESYAEMVGSLTFQTGFTKMGLKALPSGSDNPLYDFGMALKSVRVSLLILSIPIITFLLRRKVFVPWYMILFFAAGALVSYLPQLGAYTGTIKTVYTYLFTASLAAIGLNTDIGVVARNFWKPLAAVTATFAISIGAFFLLNMVF